MSIEIVHTLPEAEWRSFVLQHPKGNIFHTPEMFNVFKLALGHQPEMWAACDDNRILTLMLPVQITMFSNVWRSYTTRAVVYGGLLTTAGKDGQAALKSLLISYNQEEKGHFLFTELRHQADVSEIQPLLQSTGFAFQEHSNFLVNIAPPVDQVWRNMRASTRKKIKRAQKNKALFIEELNSIDLLPIWYDLIKQSFSWHHVFLADYSLFRAAYEILRPQKMIQFLLGRVGKTYVAASVALFYKNTIYGWYRGFNRKYGGYLPNDLMVWHLLKFGAESGYRVFDFGGAGKPNEYYGPRDFKAKFGGQLVSYGRSICVHAPVKFNLSKIGYQFFRMFF